MNIALSIIAVCVSAFTLSQLYIMNIKVNGLFKILDEIMKTQQIQIDIKTIKKMKL